MLYRDLVQFEPIESVIQLREADDQQKAAALVNTYVISDRMADVLVNVVLPQLQIDRPADNKGVLIVGNYGTGKSHLMSVLSAVAEYPDVVPLLKNEPVRRAAGQVAGRFKVARVEIGSVVRSLRDIILEELEVALDGWGTPYRFPAADRVTNNKDAIIEAVAAFHQRYPDQGILLVVDELLDYLRSRKELDLILDLSFLRELGEVAELTAFRFLGGLQETLFDNPRFAFVAEQLRRVRDRFEQVRIVREDIAYVVSERLLRKTDEQLAWITEHLRRFTPLYPGMAERLPEFARLFPIHPAYIETFERVYVAEKRQVLRTFSQAMRDLLDKPVPTEQSGLVSYDHYWNLLRNDPSMRTLPGVVEVVEKSNVLEGRIKNAYTRPNLLPIALRLIHALSVHRLTTNDIHLPLGATAQELRDDLTLYLPMPEEDADFLLSSVQVALQEIMRTVSGQYISFNDANGQYYLDVKKDIDFDAQIKERGAAMGDDQLNRAFFDTLRQLLKPDTTPYITGHRIWFHELPWRECNVMRPGYLFFGAPDERTTAQPPRDFYVYFLPPFNPQPWHGETQVDEVLFRLTNLDESVTDLVRLYAGAAALANESATHRAVYQEKATGRDGYLGRLLRWLRENLVKYLQVTHEGVTRPLPAVLADTRSSASRNIEELVEVVAAHLLSPQWAEKYPNYPAFTRLQQPVTEAARPTNAMEAARYLAGRGRTNLALAVLEGLQLVDGEGNVRPHQSPYAQKYLALLQNKPENQVVNRGELFQVVGVALSGNVEKDIPFLLEPEWSVVLLLALVHSGEIVLNLGARDTLDAGSIEQAALMALSDLVNFRFYGRPRALPLNLWVMIFEGLGLPTGLIRDETTRETAVVKLQDVVQRELGRVATLQGRLPQSVQLWNRSLFTDRQYLTEGGVVQAVAADGVALPHDTFTPELRHYKSVLETLSRFNTVGKLRNLRLTAVEINDALRARAVLARAETMLGLVDRLQPFTTYLAVAEAVLPAGHEWNTRAAAARDHLLNQVRRLAKGENGVDPLALGRDLERLKADYVAAYAQLHRQAVLGPEADARRARLYDDPRLKALNTLVGVDLLSQNRPELEWLKSRLAGLRACTAFHEALLADQPTCTCGFRPDQHPAGQSAAALMDQLDEKLSDMLLRWQQALRHSLGSDTVRQSLADMTPTERAPIERFLAQRDDDPAIPAGLVPAVNQALRGIRALALPLGDLVATLKEGGLPSTVEEFKARFNRFIQAAMRGHDPANTRLTLEE